jgi:hypothetical protein
MTPNLTDEYEPTNPGLWEIVLQVTRGDRNEYSAGDRTIHSPNNGSGFHPWPHPKGTAWAIKQYKGFGGKWRLRTANRVAARWLERIRLWPS